MRHTIRSVSAGIALSLAGCHTLPSDCERPCDICPGAVPPPAGTHVRSLQDLQIAHAEEQDFIIYEHHWYQGGTILGPDGRRHVAEIADRLPFVPFPVLIEPDTPNFNAYPDPETAYAMAAQRDVERRQLVVNALLAAGIVDAEQRVLIAATRPEGLNGNLAPFIFRQLVRPIGGAGAVGGVGFGGVASGGGGLGAGLPGGGLY